MPIETTRKLIAIYWGYVALIDQQLGRVMAAMERLGLADDTAVFFTCDHGEFTGAHRLHDKGPARSNGTRTSCASSTTQSGLDEATYQQPK